MDLENYTNVNIFKKTFEEREVTNCRGMIEQPHHTTSGNIQHGGFNPYVMHNGTVVGK